MELLIMVVLLIMGAAGGIYLSNKLNKKAESKKEDAYDFKDGLPEPKKYPPMPEIKQRGQIPPKAPPPAPKGYVPKPAAWPPAPPPVKKQENLYSNNTYNTQPQPVQPTDDFATSMALGALTGSAALGYLAGGNLAGAMIGSALNSDDDKPSRVTETYSSPSYSNDDDSYSKPSSSYDSGSSWSSSDSSSDSSSSWSSSD